MILIDAHCHLETKDFPTPADAIQRAKDAGLRHAIVVGLMQKSGDFGNAIEVAAAYPEFLTPTMGIHPHDAGEGDRRRLGDARAALRAAPGLRGRRDRARLLSTTTRRATCRPKAFAASVSSRSAGQAGGDPRARRPRAVRSRSKSEGMSPRADSLLHRQHRRRAPLPRARLPHLGLGGGDLQEDRSAPGGGRVRPARSAAGRDRQPVPRADSPPRKEERAQLVALTAGRSPSCTSAIPTKWRSSARRTRGRCSA